MRTLILILGSVILGSCHSATESEIITTSDSSTVKDSAITTSVFDKTKVDTLKKK